jgi:hypothetical protein
MTFKEFLDILYNNLHGSFSKGVFTSELLNNSVHEDCDELPKDDDAYRKYFNSGHLSKMTIDVIRKYRDPERFRKHLDNLIPSSDVLVDLCDEFKKYSDIMIDTDPKNKKEFCISVCEQYYSYIEITESKTKDFNFSNFDEFKKTAKIYINSDLTAAIKFINNAIEFYHNSDADTDDVLSYCFHLKSEAYKAQENNGNRLFAVLCDMAHRSTLKQSL